MTETPTAAPASGLYRKKPVAVPAVQWRAHGDDPDVRPYLVTDPSGDRDCEACGGPRVDHGWIGTLEAGHRVCPTDWLITGVRGERYPCKDGIFRETYEAAEALSTVTVVTPGGRTERWLANAVDTEDGELIVGIGKDGLDEVIAVYARNCWERASEDGKAVPDAPDHAAMAEAAGDALRKVSAAVADGTATPDERLSDVLAITALALRDLRDLEAGRSPRPASGAS
jgi:hypothetical protein